ncbi:chloride channel protein [Pedobacter deserti]|uniref:chloride channel protein n=1 Tax=Pedobacter deserti TaxID=2817382 RepID=UPI0021090FB8|nr:chloride channel protein [Pedobacter sp. SYSU D00382]
MRETVIRYNYFKLALASIIVGLFACLLADSLKYITEYYQHLIFNRAKSIPYLFVLLPSVGITLIYFLRKYLFKGKQNKGIKEIYQTISNRKNQLPAFKIPSHYFNGFLTVIFGGSTGIEVSTVVSTATIGAMAHKREDIANLYKTELVCAGVAAGVATLFGSPLAGMLFAVEVISRKVTKTVLLSTACASLIAWLFMILLRGEAMFHFSVSEWKPAAMPFFILLSLLAACLAVYFTRTVIFIKARFSKISSNFIRVNAGAVLVGLAIFHFPQLYGDSYHAIPGLMKQLQSNNYTSMLPLLLAAVVLLKPLVASLTLGAGGDGGVFAPSIVAGAFLGMLTATVCNHFFGTELVVVNFALVGAAAVLSAAIHAPFTAIALACSMVLGGYMLIIPVLLACFLSSYLAKYLCSYNVYTYKEQKAV